MNKRKHWMSWVIVVFLMSIPHVGVSQVCPNLEIFITKTAAEIKAWKDIYRLFKTYPGCDDGAYAEAYSEFVVHTLARHWESIGELNTLTSTDSNFHAFILKHIDATTDPDDIAAVLINTQKKCLPECKQFCREIEKAAIAANEELKNVDITTPSTHTRH